MKFTFKTGDATNPDTIDGINIILHCVNDEGIMGGGVALAIKNKWPNVYQEYMNRFYLDATHRATAQGQIQLVNVESNPNIWVCNLFGQSSIGDFYGFPAVRYGAIEEGFIRLAHIIRNRTTSKNNKVIIHTVRLGCSLAGGSWKKVSEIFKRVFKDDDIEIIVYDFPGSSYNK